MIFKRTKLLLAGAMVAVFFQTAAAQAKVSASKEGIRNAQNLKCRRQWKTAITGKNLARGLKFKSSQATTTRGWGDCENKPGRTEGIRLTDGELAKIMGKIHWDQRAVYWSRGEICEGMYVTFDLKKIRDVKKVVIRCQGGGTGLAFPTLLEAAVSKDGVNYFTATSMQKVLPAEADQADFKTRYYLEESGLFYTYPFELRVNSQARYVKLKIVADRSFVSDEIAIIAADKRDDNFNAAYSTAAEKYVPDSVTFGPYHGVLAIGFDVAMPNIFTIRDKRAKKLKRGDISFVIELPEQIDLLSAGWTVKMGAYCHIKEPVSKIVTENGRTFRRIELPVDLANTKNFKLLAPVFFKLNGPVKEEAKAVFYVKGKGIPEVKQTFPVQILDFPEFKPFKKLVVCSFGSANTTYMDYPNFVLTRKKLGYNTFSAGPRDWFSRNEKYLPIGRKALKEYRENGFKVAVIPAPFGLMYRFYKDDEWVCPGMDAYAGKRKYLKPCYSYYGKHYTAEIKRIGRAVYETQPDYIFYNTEVWGSTAIPTKKCKACWSAFEKSGKPTMRKYVGEVAGPRQMRDLSEEVKRNMKDGKYPICGMYAVDVSHGFPPYQYNVLYPDYFQIQMPSLYVKGNIKLIHDTIRDRYNKGGKKRNIIPYLTPGIYGNFPPYKMEYQVLEAFMNGCSGIIGYTATDYTTPSQEYYQAKALALLSPFEDMLLRGEIVDIEKDNKYILISAVKDQNDLLLLLGNYAKGVEDVTVELPFKKITSIEDLRDKEKIDLPDSNNLSIKVPKGSIRFLLIKGKK